MLTIEKVKQSADLLKPIIRKTDMIYSSFLSKNNNEVYLKAEN